MLLRDLVGVTEIVAVAKGVGSEARRYGVEILIKLVDQGRGVPICVHASARMHAYHACMYALDLLITQA